MLADGAVFIRLVIKCNSADVSQLFLGRAYALVSFRIEPVMGHIVQNFKADNETEVFAPCVNLQD